MVRERNFSCASDEDLLAALEGAYRGERRHLVEFLRILGEIDARKLYVERGFASTFAFLRDGLSMSEDQAYRRVATARAGRKFPKVLAMLEAGELHMTGASKLAKHLTDDNREELLDAARHRTKDEIELLIAGRFPTAPAKASIRPRTAPPALPAPPSPRGASEAESGAALFGSEAPPDAGDRHPGAPPLETSGSVPSAAQPSPARGAPEPPAPSSEAPRSTISPTSATAYTFRFSGSDQAKALLERAQDLLPHGTEVGEVFEMAMELLVASLEKKRFKTTPRPRTTPKANAPAGARYVPAAVKRTVYARDEGRCTYLSPDGRRCGETSRLELDHIFPVALGGKSTVDNLRLRCRAHNQLAAERVFGAPFMERKRSSTWPGQGSDPSPPY